MTVQVSGGLKWLLARRRGLRVVRAGPGEGLGLGNGSFVGS